MMSVVLTATLISSALTRVFFGYSFSTWQRHLRGSTIRNARDIGWARGLTARHIMRRDWAQVQGAMTVAAFRLQVPLGATAKAAIVDGERRYRGIVPIAAAFRPDVEGRASIAPLVSVAKVTLTPTTGIVDMLDRFESSGVDDLAVVDPLGKVVGTVSERHDRRRYFEKMEIARRDFFRESWGHARSGGTGLKRGRGHGLRAAPHDPCHVRI